PPPSPQEGAMNSIVEKGASKVALFLLALQSSFLCGLYGCALTFRFAECSFQYKKRLTLHKKKC
ncbi:MAG TPA: hypothetical protein GXZ40_01230, partial [Bacteroidales bacterium]|nr:hypothetical protein [Bacteroidales bacterium]